jgi:Fe-S cluster assembly iron-binding protein IscA
MPNEFPVRLTERSAAVFRERLRGLPGAPANAFVRVTNKDGGTTFHFMSGVPAATDVVGESCGIKLAVPKSDCAALAGYVIDYRSIGQKPGFILKDPRSLHSQASDPGQCKLSEDRLRRLQPELFADEPGALGDESGLQEYRESLAEHLISGDSRAAVVISTTPLVVAAYTDELDCVALLQFPKYLVAELGLRVGSRLLTVNRYQYPGGSRPGDLVPGPADTRRYINFTPLIADFLVADVKSLNRRKESIGEREWERTVKLSRDLEPWCITPRDGRPFYCHKPA